MIVSKYHGCGNDFIIINEKEVQEAHDTLALRLCDRHTGIGADGLIIVKEQPLEMIFYNCDGSRAPMCGNGIRCFARYVYEEGICCKQQFEVVTLAGVLDVNILSTQPFMVEIQMGKPSLDATLLHVKDADMIWDYPLSDQSETYTIDACFIGTIHTMLEVEDAFGTKWEAIGKRLHEHALFEEKTNVNFIQIVDEQTCVVQTYERGVGMTLACGTGCCASVWDMWKHGRMKNKVRVKLRKGFLDIRIEADEMIYMSGPAELIMKGAQVL